MMKIQRWLLKRQREFHYILLLASFLFMVVCMQLVTTDKDYLRFLLQLFSVVLMVFCALSLRAWHIYQKHERYRRRISQEYFRIIHKQRYKLERLTGLEQEILSCLLSDYSIDDIVFRLHSNYPSVYRHISDIKIKLEVNSREGLLDIDLSSALQ